MTHGLMKFFGQLLPFLGMNKIRKTPAGLDSPIMYHLKEHLVSWKKLEFAASNVACNTMKEAALEIRSNETNTEFSQCGVSVDGTWQRRGYSSLNGCVSVISIDSGKSVVPAKNRSRSSRHCWRSPLPHTSALIQGDFGCVLGVQQIKQLPHVAKVDLSVSRVFTYFSVEIWLWPRTESNEGQLDPTSRRCSAGCLKYRQCVLEECEGDIRYTPYHTTRCGASVAMHNAAVQHPLSTVSTDSNPTIAELQTNV
ncbi:hypothetical protein TNCV_1890351 [Trichonephila clavipes]|nr:hypothetical protein TNCV_1890351 [Trichonephila clavipes]